MFVVGCCLSVSAAMANSPDWAEYDRLLQRYVVAGTIGGVELHQVDYVGLGQDPGFTKLVADLAAFPLQQLEDRNETLAFYINAYNILALKVVMENSPLQSIKDVGSIFRPVWKRPAGVIDSESISLHEIEHERLRKMDEPRIHFAIVCASVSCPDLRMEAYRAERLEQQLDAQTADFLNNPSKGLRLDGKRAEISQIFKWFDSDFKAQGGVERFVRRYVQLPDDVRLQPSIDYDWGLNGLSEN